MADRPLQGVRPEKKTDESEEGNARIKAWSYSRLSIFEKCPYRAFLSFVEKRPEPPDTDRTALNRGSMVHEAAEQYVKHERDDLIDELAKFEEELTELRELYPGGMSHVEEKWAFDRDWGIVDDYYGDDVWVRLALDHFRWLDEDKTVASFIDYKTGKERPIPHSQQRMLYAIACFLRFPELQELEGMFWYTDIGPKKTRPKVYTREEAMTFLPTWTNRGRNMTDTDDFPAKPNRMNCRYCPYGPSNGDDSCPWGVI